MKLQNLKISKNLGEAKYFLIMGTALWLFISSEFYDEQEQIVEDSSVCLVNTIDEEGQLCHEFLPGEHKIKRTRVDSFGYETEPIDGYMIENVTLKCFGNRNIITYVNTLPVIVRGVEQKDGTITFDEFGEVITKDSVKSLGSMVK
ncbi:MAG: hypothetical protein K2G03_06620 [Bacilli bacterium]|nr:hypothetical protein [Bacilli bacterium]